jgi:hypothetical protein
MFGGMYLYRNNARAVQRRATLAKEPMIVEAEDILALRQGDTLRIPKIGNKKPTRWKMRRTVADVSNGFTYGDNHQLDPQHADLLKAGYAYAINQAMELVEFTCACHPQRERRPRRGVVVPIQREQSRIISDGKRQIDL